MEHRQGAFKPNINQKRLSRRSKPSSKSLRKGNTICESMKCHGRFRKTEVIQGVQKVVCILVTGGNL